MKSLVSELKPRRSWHFWHGLLMRDRIAQLFLIPLIYLLFRDEEKLKDWQGSARLIEPAISMGYIFLLWEGNRYYAVLWYKRLPDFSTIARRLFSHVFTCTCFVLLLNLALVGLLHLTGLFPAITFATLKSNILGGLTITYLVIAIHEGMNFYKGWKANLERSQSLAREKAEMQLALVDAQLSALRDQLDPHFLFNSLNTLSSLIDLKNEKAIAYLEQLADVYRYVLENREKHLVPLSEEIAFANAYMNLVKTRFRDDLIFDVKPDRITTEACLPPYALQLLLENAIKHNAIAEDSPLRIKVTCEPGCLVVSNNRQPKKTLASSTRLGLSNLQHRCRLTTQKPLVILESTDAFTVKVPLVTSPYSKVTNDNQSVASYAHHNH